MHDYDIGRIYELTIQICRQTHYEYMGKAGMLAAEKYESRKKKDAITQCLNKRLFMGIVRQRKGQAEICSNDASQFYDRITHPMISLDLGSLGIPQSYTACILSMMHRMNHQIRTGYGDSDLNFSGESWNIPPQGVIQGSGMAPTVWAIVSSSLFDIMIKAKSG